MGSGFGLYGYTPAAIRSGYRVHLSERYIQRFESREELLPFREQIDFVKEDDLLRDAALCIIAKRPSDQYELLPLILDRASASKIMLEKPLAASPDQAKELCSLLRDSKKAIRIGYAFLYTSWGREVVSKIKAKKADIRIEWDFLAYHFKHDISNWKRFTSQGGGALRFYGIQFIGLLAAAGVWDVEESTISCANLDEAIRWKTELHEKGGSHVFLSIDSHSIQSKFHCQINTGKDFFDFSADSPFESSKSRLDSRIDCLSEIIRSFEENVLYSIDDSIMLWSKIETHTHCLPL